MNEIKKNGFLKAACLMLVVMLLAVYILPGTMAKYMSTGTASGLTVTVARWSIIVGDDDIVDGNVDLTSISWKVDSLDEEVEVPEGATTIIPGTWGYAEIVIKNESDVAADITIEGLSSFLPTDYGNDALKFAVVDTGSDDTPPSGFGVGDDLSTEDSYNFTLASRKSASGNSKTIYVCYEWAYINISDDPAESNNEADMDIVKNAPKFGTLTVIAVQAKDPA